jgi:hypothetical protein
MPHICESTAGADVTDEQRVQWTSMILGKKTLQILDLYFIFFILSYVFTRILGHVFIYLLLHEN